MRTFLRNLFWHFLHYFQIIPANIKAIFLTDTKEQKEVISLANRKKSQQACLKALSFALYFSTFLLIFFFSLKLLHIATMQTTILCIL